MTVKISCMKLNYNVIFMWLNRIEKSGELVHFKNHYAMPILQIYICTIIDTYRLNTRIISYIDVLILNYPTPIKVVSKHCGI